MSRPILEHVRMVTAAVGALQVLATMAHDQALIARLAAAIRDWRDEEDARLRREREAEQTRRVKA